LRDPHPAALPELVQLARLETLHEAVERARLRARDGVVVDEGPVFALSWMEVFYPDRAGPHFTTWRRAALARWAATLDRIVLVDAPDATLVARLRTRAKAHPVKAAPELEIRRFMAAFRAAFSRVLADLGALGGPRLVTFVTGEEPTDRLADRVLTFIARGDDGN
jgi:hypothetical protein